MKISHELYKDLPLMYQNDPTSEFLRIGQWFVNKYFTKGMVDPELFYETSIEKCGKIILQKYVEKD